MAKVKVRLMDELDDYKTMGTKKGVIEPWEDGKRDDDRAGVYEWWYFDMILDDGSKVVIHFNTKDNKTIAKDGTIPSVVIKITSPNGKEYKDNVILNSSDAYFGEGKCDVKFGPHFIKGDLKTYHIHVDKTGGVNGTDGSGGMGEASNVACDLVLTSTSKPWRPGAGGFSFGEDGYFTWLCAVPRGNVKGTLFYNNEEHQVKGTGYHDHQWGNVKHNSTWDHWIWGRQDFGDYAILVFDIGTQKKFGYQRLPMMFLEDKDGNLVMEDLTTPKCKFIEEYKEKVSNKIYPKKIEYTFKYKEMVAKYTIEQSYELESRDPTKQLPKILGAILKIKGLHPSTSRNFAKGTLELFDGKDTIKRSGDMIYEFVYMGTTVKEKMEN